MVKYVECTIIKLFGNILGIFYITKSSNGYYLSSTSPTKTKNTVFFVHGGGFCVHTATEKLVTTEIFKLYPNCRFYHCDYTLCPSASLDDIFEECWSQYLTVHKESKGRLVIMGDSAGGNMALQLHLHSLSLSSPHRRPLGSVLLSPWLDVAGTSDLASYKTNVKTDYMSPRFAKAFATICREGSGGKVEDLPSILRRSMSLQDSLIVIGGGELMADEGVALWLSSGGSKGSVEIYLGDEAPHDFVMAPAFCKTGVFEEAWRVIATRVKVWFGDYGEVVEGWEDLGDEEEEVEVEEEEGEEEPDHVGYEYVKKYVDKALKTRGKTKSPKSKSSTTAKRSRSTSRRRNNSSK